MLDIYSTGDTINEIVIGPVSEVDDGGTVAYETTLTGKDLFLLKQLNLLRVWNPRPDHATVTLKSGKERYAKTAPRSKRWTEELMRGEATIGNISIRILPGIEFTIDEDGFIHIEVNASIADPSRNTVVLDTYVDAATRIRSIIAAVENPMDMAAADTRFATRVWDVDDALGNKLFHDINQTGKPVEDTVAKFLYQSSNEQTLAKRLAQTSAHLKGNIEVTGDRVSANSNKLCSFNTLSQALEAFWSHAPDGTPDAELDRQAAWLVDFWSSLATLRPEFGVLPTPARQRARLTTVAGSALSIHGVVGLADAMYAANTPLTELKVLADDAWWAKTNPLWQQEGVVVSATDKHGNPVLNFRNAYQSRTALKDALIAKVI